MFESHKLRKKISHWKQRIKATAEFVYALISVNPALEWHIFKAMNALLLLFSSKRHGIAQVLQEQGHCFLSSLKTRHLQQTGVDSELQAHWYVLKCERIRMTQRLALDYSLHSIEKRAIHCKLKPPLLTGFSSSYD